MMEEWTNIHHTSCCYSGMLKSNIPDWLKTLSDVSSSNTKFKEHPIDRILSKPTFRELYTRETCLLTPHNVCWWSVQQARYSKWGMKALINRLIQITRLAHYLDHKTCSLPRLHLSESTSQTIIDSNDHQLTTFWEISEIPMQGISCRKLAHFLEDYFAWLSIILYPSPVSYIANISSLFSSCHWLDFHCYNVWFVLILRNTSCQSRL